MAKTGLSIGINCATLFLDHVVDKNAYVPAVPELREAALNARRIGLGIMGLADLMYHCGVRYGSEESLDFCGQVMEFVRFYAMETSIEEAEKLGAFPVIKGSIYDPQDMKWQAPTPLVPETHNWQRPSLDWEVIVQGIKNHGIRNAAQTTIAPTGTIGTVAGVEGYGCEPVFALAYVRHVNDKGKDLLLNYARPYQEALDKSDLVKAKTVSSKSPQPWTCQNMKNCRKGFATLLLSLLMLQPMNTFTSGGFATLC